MKSIDAVWVHQSYLLPLYNFSFPANHFPLTVASLQTLEACALSLSHQGASVARWIALLHCEPSDPGQAVPPRRRASLLRCRSSFRCSLLAPTGPHRPTWTPRQLSPSMRGRRRCRAPWMWHRRLFVSPPQGTSGTPGASRTWGSSYATTCRH